MANYPIENEESLPACCIPGPFGKAESAVRPLFSGCA